MEEKTSWFFTVYRLIVDLNQFLGINLSILLIIFLLIIINIILLSKLKKYEK